MALDHPIAICGVILAWVESKKNALDEVAQLLVINRVSAANVIHEDVYYFTRWGRHVGGKESLQADSVKYFSRMLVMVEVDMGDTSRFHSSKRRSCIDRTSSHVYCTHPLQK